MTVATLEPRDATLGVDHPAASRPEGVAGAGDFDIDDGDDTSYIAVTVSGGEVLRYYSSCAGGEALFRGPGGSGAACVHAIFPRSLDPSFKR